MSFVHYRIVLKLLSPLHIGKRKYRNLMETREYVPGRTLWGALTARITRDYFDCNPDFYRKVGDFLTQNFRFGYLWPSVEVEKNQNQSEIRKFKVYLPWKSKEKSEKEKHGELEFSYEFIGPDYFDYLFKFGYMGQPVDYDRKATEEGQLHEVEFIGPKTREGQQVYLVGDLWVKSDALTDVEKVEVKLDSKIIPLKGVFGTLQLGGERNYGWGRVKVEIFEKLENSKALGGIDVENHDEVILKFNENDHVTAHVIAAEWQDMKLVQGTLWGQVEPLTGYRMNRDGEWSIPEPPVCYIPGTVVRSPINLKISAFGGILAN